LTHLTAKIFSAGQARVAPWCGAPQAARNDAGGQKMAASGGADWPSGRVPQLARCVDQIRVDSSTR